MNLFRFVAIAVFSLFNTAMAQEDSKLKFHKPRLIKESAEYEKSPDFEVNDSGQAVFFYGLGSPRNRVWLTKSNKFEDLPEDINRFRGRKIRGDGRLITYGFKDRLVVYDVAKKSQIVEGTEEMPWGFRRCIFADKATVIGVDSKCVFFKWELRQNKFTKLGEMPKDSLALNHIYSFAPDFSRAIRAGSENRFTHIDFKTGKVTEMNDFEERIAAKNGCSAAENLAVVTKSGKLFFYDFGTQKSQEFKPKKAMKFSDVYVNDRGNVAVVNGGYLAGDSGFFIFDLQSRPCKMVGHIPMNGLFNTAKVAISSNGKFVVHSDDENKQAFLYQIAK